MLELVTQASTASEVYEVTRFVAHRRRPDDETREVSIEVRDRGPGPWPRWHVSVVDETGLEVTGNPDDKLAIALLGVHWSELDA
jgi:hypothetical protein